MSFAFVKRVLHLLILVLTWNNPNWLTKWKGQCLCPETVYFGKTTWTSLACTAVCALWKASSFHEWAGIWGVLLVSLASDTFLLNLIVILIKTFFNYTSNRKLLLQDIKNTSGKCYRNTTQSHKSSLFFSSFSFLLFPQQSPSLRESKKSNTKTWFLALCEGWVWEFRLRLSTMVKDKVFSLGACTVLRFKV